MFINQIRMKIGVMFGSPETTSGGNALKFYASVRLDIRRVGAIKETVAGAKEPSVVGNRTRVKVVKNKMAPPFREVEFDILYGQGISRAGDVLDLGVEANVVEKSGAWFSFQGERIGQGRDNTRTYLEQNPSVLNRIEALLLEKHGLRRAAIEAASKGSEPLASSTKPLPEKASAAAQAAKPADPNGKPASREAAPADTRRAAPAKTN